MNQDFSQYIKNIKNGEPELNLMLEGAPFLSGLRAANLVNMSRTQFKSLKPALQNTNISYYILFNGGDKFTVLLYRYQELQQYLSCLEARNILDKRGYHSTDVYELLFLFALNYKKFLCGMSDFPHEMGLFLAYPIEDVIGFIKNDGKNSLCTGYWKVYEDVSEKKKLFDSFELAKQRMMQLISRGLNVMELVTIISPNRYQTLSA